MLEKLQVFLLVIAITSCSANKDKLEDNEVERKPVGGLSIPSSLEPIEVMDELLPNGDGILLHRYLVDEPLYKNISDQLAGMSRELPFADNVYVDNIIYEYLDETDKGLYKLASDEEDPRDISLIVLNKTKMELIILISRS